MRKEDFEKYGFYDNSKKVLNDLGTHIKNKKSLIPCRAENVVLLNALTNLSKVIEDEVLEISNLQEQI